MLHYGLQDAGHGVQLGGSSSVSGLQTALANLAKATLRPAINPGPIDGIVGSQTIAAVTAALGLLSEQLPTWLYVVLQAGLAVGGSTSQAKSLITQYAGPLTVAANTAAVKFRQNPPAPTTPTAPTPTTVGFFAPGWYKTPIGIVLIALLGFGTYKLVLAPRKAAA